MTEDIILVSPSYILLKSGIKTFYIGRKYWNTLSKAIRIGKKLSEGEIRVLSIEGETIIPREEEILEEEYEEEW